MALDYFYGNQGDQFSFYRIPKVLFTNERFRCVSAEAKILYGILLDRMSLSCKNGWMDTSGRVYIIFTIDEVMESIGCAEQKAIKLLGELENKAGLIERKRQGLGKPNLIFVKNFVTIQESTPAPLPKSQLLNCENDSSGTMKIEIPELPKSQGSNTNLSYTDFNDTDILPIPSATQPYQSRVPVQDRIGADERQQYEDYLEDALEKEILLERHPSDGPMIEEIMELLLDTICSNRQYIRIAGDDKPREIVKSQLMKLTSEHIEYVLKSIKDSDSKVRNMKQYLLASLYNAPLTMSSYYEALVRHDMAQGRI